MTHPPEKLPEPWLFNSEKLLQELDNCRELVLRIPAHDSETHFAANRAIYALWDLRSVVHQRPLQSDSRIPVASKKAVLPSATPPFSAAVRRISRKTSSLVNMSS
jgi:hypothetical protein